jgi:hypothetical protein
MQSMFVSVGTHSTVKTETGLPSAPLILWTIMLPRTR